MKPPSPAAANAALRETAEELRQADFAFRAAWRDAFPIGTTVAFLRGQKARRGVVRGVFVAGEGRPWSPPVLLVVPENAKSDAPVKVLPSNRPQVAEP